MSDSSYLPATPINLNRSRVRLADDLWNSLAGELLNGVSVELQMKLVLAFATNLFAQADKLHTYLWTCCLSQNIHCAEEALYNVRVRNAVAGDCCEGGTGRFIQGDHLGYDTEMALLVEAHWGGKAAMHNNVRRTGGSAVLMVHSI